MKSAIGLKIWAAFVSLVLVMLVVGFTAYQATNRLIDTAQWVDHTHAVVLKLEELMSALKDAESGQRGYLITGQEPYLVPYRQSAQKVGTNLDELKRLVADNPAQQRRIEAIAPLVAAKLDILAETIELRRTRGMEAARQFVLTGKSRQAMLEVRNLVGLMEDEEKTLLVRRDAETRDSAREALTTIVGGVLVAAVLAAAAGLLLSRHIAQPLVALKEQAVRIAAGEISVTPATRRRRRDEIGLLEEQFERMTSSLQAKVETARQIADGDLRTQVKLHSERDELGEALATMVSNLREMNRDVSEGVNVLSAATSQILAGMNETTAGATQTAAAMTETATTVAEVKQTATLVSEKARVVAQAAQKSAQVSQLGRQAVEETTEGMQRIREQMEQIADSILRLTEQGQAIGEIIATVNDLSEQSNLLAVNASIEAAKAGEHGRGFAVVAQEVKSLAEQSKQATAQVRTILGDIRRATDSAVQCTEQGNAAVEAGVRQSREAGEAIRQLNASMAESAQAASQIAVSTQQQLAGMDQLAQATENIKTAMAQNLDSVRQTETAARNLHELGRKLGLLVGRYRV